MHDIKRAVAQFDCHPEQAFFAQSRDLGEPREASRTLRRNNRAFGSLPYQSKPLPIKALLGTPGEAVPRVKADDLKKLWKMGQDLNSRNPGEQGVMGADMLEMACSPGADTRAVWFRGARLGMLNMSLKNPLGGRVGRHLQWIAFAVFAKIPMKWWEVGVPRRTLF